MRSGNVRVAFDEPMQVGECPVWHPEEGALYWVDIIGKKVHHLREPGQVHQEWSMPTEPAAIAICASGGLIVAMRHGVAHLDTETGTLRDIAPAPYDTTRVRFNDGRCDAAGRFWIGTMYEPRDQQLGEMYVLEHGNLKRAWQGGMTVSNGLAFSLDNRTMYHADTTSHTVRAFDFELKHGAVGASRIIKQFSTDKTSNYGGRPDGAAIDSEGAYWCAMFEGSRILRLNALGEILVEIPLPVRCPTMVAFGGPDLRRLYITSASHKRSAEELQQFPASGKLLCLDLDIHGRHEPFYRQ